MTRCRYCKRVMPIPTWAFCNDKKCLKQQQRENNERQKSKQRANKTL